MSISTDDSTLLNDSTESDWRVRLFGDYILSNSKAKTSDEDADLEGGEQSITLIPTHAAFDESKYDFIAVFVGADYCPHCKAFAPSVHASAPILEDELKTKVVFVSNDRTDEAFEASRLKNEGIDVVPYDLDKTSVMRNLFKLTTIPAMMILKNDHFADPDPVVVTNARHALISDPKCKYFPWAAVEESADSASKIAKVGASPISKDHLSMTDRLVKRGKYGKWYELGHHVNPTKPEEMYMDEHAVRIRAGLLNIITWMALINVSAGRETKFSSIFQHFRTTFTDESNLPFRYCLSKTDLLLEESRLRQGLVPPSGLRVYRFGQYGARTDRPHRDPRHRHRVNPARRAVLETGAS